MSDLTTEQLGEVAALIGTRLAEFGKLFDEPSHGEVRLYYDAIREWQARESVKRVYAAAGYPPPAIAGQDGEQASDEDDAWEGDRGGHADDDPLGDVYHAGFMRGRKVGRQEAGSIGAPQGPRQVTHSAPIDDPPEDDPPPTHAPNDPDNITLVGEKAAEVRRELEAHWPDLADQPDGIDVFPDLPIAGADGPAPSGPAPAAIDDPPQSDEKLASVEAEPPALSPTTAAALGPEHTLVTPVKPIGRERDPRVPDPDVARDKIAQALAAGSNGDLAVATINKPRTLDEVEAEAELDALRMGSQGKAAALREALTELQLMAVDGVMPTMTEWNEKRPGGMITADGLIKRHELTWSELARYARLTPNRRGGKR